MSDLTVPGTRVDRAKQWQRTMDWLAGSGAPILSRTSSCPLRDFAHAYQELYAADMQADVAATFPARGEVLGCTSRLVRGGISPEDVAAFARLEGAQDTSPTELSSALLQSFLLDLEAIAPQMPLRVALGWSMAMVGGTDLYVAPGDVAARWSEWNQVGLGEGWLYAAAGFSAPEAATMLADGSLTEDQARVLAALRSTTALLP